jgi:CBS domain-containing protein
MLSRLDIFRMVMREAPDWNAFRAQNIQVTEAKIVGDILRRDTHAVSPDTSVDEVIRVIGRNDIQRVAVVDDESRLLGLISDRDLLHYFKPDPAGILGALAKIKGAFKTDKEAGSGTAQWRLEDVPASAVMRTELTTVRESTTVEEAIAQMTQKALKRLPVVDDQGRFMGMISRDSLLRTGFGSAAPK